MNLFAPLSSLDEKTHRAQLAQAANAGLRGETHNTGKFTVAVGASSFILTDARLGVGKMLFLTALDVNGAGLQPYVSEILNGTATIQFLSMPSAEADFAYAIIGMGGGKGV